MRILFVRFSFFLLFLSSSQVACSQQIATGKTQKPNYIWTVEWSPDDKYIAVGGDDSMLYLYNSKDYRLYKSFRANSMIKGAAWHPEGKILAIANMKGVQLLDINKGELNTLSHITTGGRAVAWNYNGELLGFADGAGILQIMTKQGTLVKSIPRHNNHSYLSLHWHPSKNIIVAASDDVVVFDTAGKQITFFKHRTQNAGILTARWHPSGEFFATGDYGHEDEGIPTLLQFWTEDGKLLKTMKGSKAEYRNIRWNKEGSLLATASDKLRIWTKEGKLIDSAATGYDLWGVSWNFSNNLIVTTSFGRHIDIWTNRAKLLKKIEE